MSQAREYRYMIIGAHQDDCESSGGIALKLLDLGRRVRFLTATNGCSGHHLSMGGGLAARRQAEAERVSALTGVEYEMLDFDDGSLVPGLEERKAMIAAIRRFDPDVIITHRPWDYHPDHRYTSQLVQDSSFLVQVPNVCPLTPVMRRMPAIFYMQDDFKKPMPFSPDLVFDIDAVMERKMRMYHQYASQMYEWLPWVGQLSRDPIPEGDEARFEWLKHTEFTAISAGYADRFRPQLQEKYGAAGANVRYAEALEFCEYGEQLTPEAARELFPF